MAKKTPKRSTPSMKTRAVKSVPADELFEHLSLKHVRLISVQAQLSITEGKTPTVAEINTTTAVGPSNDELTIHANIFVIVTAKPKGGGEGCSSLVVTAQYQCVYEIIGARAPDLIDHVEQIAANGTLVAWPHLRELVQSLTAKMEIPPFILPLYSIGPNKAQLGPSAETSVRKTAKKAPKKAKRPR